MGGCQSSPVREDIQHLRRRSDTAAEQAAQPTGEQLDDTEWVRLGGAELEEPLMNGWIKLLRSDWLIDHAEKGGVLARRQDMPIEAYISLEELKQAGPGIFTGFSEPEEWLRIIVLSHPWLQPAHPDPYGENLRRISKVLKHFVNDSFQYSNGGRPYGVLMDFTALFQSPRTEQEQEVFLRSLPALSVFYSHPHTVVFKITQFPDGYPFHYDLPACANTSTYSERGWCFTESAMSGLVKSLQKVLDLDRYNEGDNLGEVISCCKAGRVPPMHPDDFNEELDVKKFSDKNGDFEKVAKLYSAAFERRLSSATALDYHDFGWGVRAAHGLARALQGICLLQTLNLNSNSIGDWGAIDLAEALQHNTSLQKLTLRHNGIGQQGAAALARAPQRNSVLDTLDLGVNHIGPEGAAELGKALSRNNSLWTLRLDYNNIGPEGAASLGQALQSKHVLRTLTVEGNSIGERGTIALGEALRSNCSLQELNLRGNRVGDRGAAALGGALRKNSSLQTLDLRSNQIREGGAVALGLALQSNSALRLLHLESNTINSQGKDVLTQAAEPRATTLQLLL